MQDNKFKVIDLFFTKIVKNLLNKASFRIFVIKKKIFQTHQQFNKEQLKDSYKIISKN